MAPAKITRAQLEAELDKIRSEHRAELTRVDDLRADLKAQRTYAADLKERLANAEAENQRMRGYIARVQEDDIVREDLVPIGDPAGEQQLVPKRKPTHFDAPSPYSQIDGCGQDRAMSYVGSSRDRPKPKHWVTY